MSLNKEFIKTKNNDMLFLKSLCVGVFIWIFFYTLTPVVAVNSISKDIIWFILSNYIALILGYYLTNNILKKKTYVNFNSKNLEGFVNVIFILILFSSVVRFIDLFFIREVSFFNSISSNKYNLAQEDKFSITLGILSFFRLLYFVPYLFYVVEKKKKKKLLVLFLLLFLIPITEGLLRGSRRLIFEPIGILITIICVYNFSKLFSKKIILMTIVVSVFIVFISNFILKERIHESRDKEFLEKIYVAPYNDLLPLKLETQEYLLQNKSSWIGKTTFTLVHIGQYMLHGVYEFDYLYKLDPVKRKGMYNGFIVVKLLNKLHLSNISLDFLTNPTKRVTYITFFGGLYLDFGWFSLIIMLFFGAFQKVIFQYSCHFRYLKPLVIALVFSNAFLLVFNFLRSGLIVFVLIYLMTLFLFYNRKKLLKYI